MAKKAAVNILHAWAQEQQKTESLSRELEERRIELGQVQLVQEKIRVHMSQEEGNREQNEVEKQKRQEETEKQNELDELTLGEKGVIQGPEWTARRARLDLSFALVKAQTQEKKAATEQLRNERAAKMEEWKKRYLAKKILQEQHQKGKAHMVREEENRVKNEEEKQKTQEELMISQRFSRIFGLKDCISLALQKTTELEKLKQGTEGQEEMKETRPEAETRLVSPGLKPARPLSSGSMSEQSVSPGSTPAHLASPAPPGVVRLDPGAPGVVSLEAYAPGIVGLEAGAPGVVRPEADTLGVFRLEAGAGAPGVAMLEASAPGAVGLDVGAPGDAGAPDLVRLDASAPGVTRLEAGAPGVVELNAGAPGVARLDASAPGVARLAAGAPGVVGLEADAPGIVRPEAGSSDIARLDAGKPGVARVETGAPGAVGLEAGAPGIARLDSDEPGVARLGASALSAARFDAGAPGVAKLDVGAPGVARLDACKPAVVRLEAQRGFATVRCDDVAAVLCYDEGVTGGGEAEASRCCSLGGVKQKRSLFSESPRGPTQRLSASAEVRFRKQAWRAAMRGGGASVAGGGKAEAAHCDGRGSVDKKPKFKLKRSLFSESRRGVAQRASAPVGVRCCVEARRVRCAAGERAWRGCRDDAVRLGGRGCMIPAGAPAGWEGRLES